MGKIIICCFSIWIQIYQRHFAIGGIVTYSALITGTIEPNKAVMLFFGTVLTDFMIHHYLDKNPFKWTYINNQYNIY